MFLKTVRSMTAGQWILTLVLSFAVSFLGVFGWSYGSSGSAGIATISSGMAIILTGIFGVVAAFIILLCNAALTKLAFASLNRDAAKGANASRLNRFDPRMRAASVLLFALILIIFWLPYLMRAFPGATYSDTPIQMQQLYEEMHPLDVLSGGYVYISPEEASRLEQASEDIVRSTSLYPTDAWMVDHHPFALTLLYGNLALLSDSLFGSWMPALGFLMVIQVILFALELSLATAYMRHRRAPLSLCFAVYLFFCLMPIIPSVVATVMKDCAFTLGFIPFFILLTEAAFTHGALFQKKRYGVALIFLSIILCLTRKSGIYVVLAVAVFGAIVFAIRLVRARRSSDDVARAKSTASSFACGTFLAQGLTCALLMFAVIPGIVYPALNIAAGGRQEMLGTLFQQTARVYAKNGENALTAEEQEAVRAVMRTFGLDIEYQPTVTDQVKAKHYLDATDEDVRAYLGAYVSMGLRFPENYLASLMCTAGGYVSPLESDIGVAKPRTAPWTWNLPFDDDRTVLWAPDETAPLRAAMQAFYDTLDQIPGLNLLLRGVLYDLWIPVIILFFCVRNRLRSGITLVPFFAVLAICMVSPLYDLRYIYPVIFCAPLLTTMSVAQAKQAFKERTSTQIS